MYVYIYIRQFNKKVSLSQYMNLPSFHIIKWKIPDTSKSIEQIEPIKIYTGPSINSISVDEFFPGESIQIDKVFKTNYNEKWVSYIGLQGKRRYILLPNDEERYIVFPPFENDDNDIEMKNANDDNDNDNDEQKERKYMQYYEDGCFHWQGDPSKKEEGYNGKCWLCSKGSKLLSMLMMEGEEPNKENIKKYFFANLGTPTKSIKAPSIACLKERNHHVYIEKYNENDNTFDGFDPQAGRFYCYSASKFQYCFPKEVNNNNDNNNMMVDIEK